MEFKRVVGTRRSIRFLKPWRPVERDKIQAMLEAANRASRSVNADYPKAIVVNRDDLPDEVRESLRNPTTTAELDLAPTYIFWYFDLNYIYGAHERLKELVAQKALPPAYGWSPAYVDDIIWPQVLGPMSEDKDALLFMGAVETGQAICSALLAAVDEGLGSCLHAFGANAERINEHFKVPETWVPVWLQLVGYPLEETEAGGQRPRRPLSDSFYEGSLDTPFIADPDVTQQLVTAGMIQTPGPLPWRDTEVRMLSRMFGLPE